MSSNENTKVAVFADLHWGVRNDSPIFLDYFAKFYRDFAFPILQEQNITNVILAGDIVDRRKYISYNTHAYIKQHFISPLQEMQCKLFAIPGNHDCPYKNNLNNNALNALLVDFDPVEQCVFDEPTVRTIDNRKFGFVPWICDENRDAIEAFLRTTDAEVIIGHFELQGFEMYRGLFAEHGMSLELLERFPLVLSGHFHHKSNRNNVHYLGACSEMTWGDWDDPRGFHILDTKTLEMTHYQNPYKIHTKIVYDDTNRDMIKELSDINIDAYKDTFVKILSIGKARNPTLLDRFVERLSPLCLDVRVNVVSLIEDDKQGFETSKTILDVDKQNDMIGLFNTIVDNDTGVSETDHALLKEYLSGVYNQALLSISNSNNDSV